MKQSKLNVQKILVAAAFILITLDMYTIIFTPPATGYEMSIYDSYPPYFWLFLIVAITCGIVILLDQAWAEKKSKWWLAGLIVIIFTNTVFLLLPEFRGYLFYGRSDTTTHLGRIKDILLTGHVGESNFYPIIHILGNILIQVAGLSLENVPSVFFVLFSGIYIINMYLLAKSTSNHPTHVLLTVAFASPLIYSFFHINIHPSLLSLFMVPCLLYLYQKREQSPNGQSQNTLLLLLLAFFITFCHPVTTLFAIVVLLTFGLAHTLYLRFPSHNKSGFGQYENIGINFFGLSLIMFITFFTWYFSYASIQKSFKRVYDWLVYQIGTPLIEAILEPLAKSGLTPIQTLELFINRNGAIFLFLLISGIACISILGKSLSRKSYVDPINFTYALQFLMALLIAFMMLFGNFAEYEYNPVRLFRLPLLIGTILSGLVVSGTINGGSMRRVAKMETPTQISYFMIILATAIVVMTALSLGSIYGSPRVCTPNQQVTQMEISGTEWFEQSKDTNISVMANSPRQIARFEDYIFGVDSSSISRMKRIERLPSHFGYDKYDRIAEALGFQDTYLIIFEFDKVAALVFPENVRPKAHQYTEEDFARLDSDRDTAKLYCNGEYEVWRVTEGENNR